MRALVIDDSKAVRGLLKRELSHLGFEVFEAGNGQEGMDQLAELGPVDVALVDWTMPVMDGLLLPEGGPVQPRLRARPGRDGHVGERPGADLPGPDGGCRRVRHETDHRRGAGGETGVGRPGRRRVAIARPRVLVVDDSVVVRRLVSQALEQVGSIEVVGVAADGHIALMKIPLLHPDVVLLDVEMPNMDGLQCLAEIRRRWPKVKCVMFSTLTTRAAAATLDALTLGASDYVPKPQGLRNPAEGLAYVHDEVVPRILALSPGAAAESATEGLLPPARRPGEAAARRRPQIPGRVDVLAIGASTGGPNALTTLLSGVARRAASARRGRAAHAAAVHAAAGGPPVRENAPARPRGVRTATCSRPARCWSPPATSTWSWRDRGARPACGRPSDPPENSCRPSVDPLFRSVAQVFGPTPSAWCSPAWGRTGCAAAEAIRAAGGQIVAQDEASSVVWGMPGFVARAGLADSVVSINQMARDVMSRVAPRRAPVQLAGSAER